MSIVKFYGVDEMGWKKTNNMPIHLDSITFRENFQRACEKHWQGCTKCLQTTIQTLFSSISQKYLNAHTL